MKEGIATDDDILKKMLEKTDYNEEVIKANIHYIKNRVTSLMDREDVHSIRLSGLGVIIENYQFLKLRTFKKTQHKDFYDSIVRKADHLKDLLGKVSNTQRKAFLKKHIFLKRRKFKHTDFALENLQNEQHIRED